MTTVDERTAKEKFSAFCEEAKKKARDGAAFIKENPGTIPIICSGIMGASKITAKVIASRTQRREQDFQMRRIYDRSLGRYIELKRPLTTKEAIEIEARRLNGEKITSILDSMRLVK